MVPFAAGRPTTAQAAVHHRVTHSAVMWLTRMLKADAPPHTSAEAWSSFESAVAAPILELDAEAVDLPATAGTCEPSDLLGLELSDILKSPDVIAPNEPIGHAVHRVPRHSMPEYVRLTIRELRLCSWYSWTSQKESAPSFRFLSPEADKEPCGMAP